MEREYVAPRSRARQDLMRALLTRYLPSKAKQCREHVARFRRPPLPQRYPLRRERHTCDQPSFNLASFDLIGKDPKRERTNQLRRPLLRIAVHHHAGEFGNLRDPTSVGFLLKFNRQGHGQPKYDTACGECAKGRQSTPGSRSAQKIADSDPNMASTAVSRRTAAIGSRVRPSTTASASLGSAYARCAA